MPVVTVKRIAMKQQFKNCISIGMYTNFHLHSILHIVHSHQYPPSDVYNLIVQSFRPAKAMQYEEKPKQFTAFVSKFREAYIVDGSSKRRFYNQIV